MEKLRDRLDPKTVEGLNDLVQTLKFEEREQQVASLVEELDRIAALGRSALVGGLGGITLPSGKKSTGSMHNVRNGHNGNHRSSR